MHDVCDNARPTWKLQFKSKILNNQPHNCCPKTKSKALQNFVKRYLCVINTKKFFVNKKISCTTKRARINATHVASTVGVIVGTLHTSGDLVTPGGFALDLRNQSGVSVLKSVWDWSVSEDSSPSSHQSLSSSCVFLAGNSDWLDLEDHQ